MRILALGAGDMARMAIAVLIESDIVEALTVADKNYELAKTFVDLVSSDKLTAVEIDVIERVKLLDLISSHDIVMNTVGPYYKFATMILDACIESKKPYVDICDDWKPTLDMLERDKAAKDAGINALIGIGASPGITNLMVVLACHELDEVDKVITAWGEWIRRKEGKKQSTCHKSPLPSLPQTPTAFSRYATSSFPTSPSSACCTTTLAIHTS